MNVRTWPTCLVALALTLLSSARATAAVIAVPPIEVQTLTHTFTPASGFPDFDPASILDGFSIGSGYTGGGAYSVPSVSNGDTATIRVQAPAGKKFVVHDANALLALNLYWQAGGDASSLSGGTVTFENLTGASPPNTYTFLSVGNSGNVISANLQFQPVGLIEFTALDITIPVQSSPAAGVRNFGSVQSSSSVAFYAFVSSGTDHTLLSLETVPEPSGFALAAMSLTGVAAFRRKRNS